MTQISRSARRQIIVSVIACCFLAFVGGAFVADFRVFPYSFIFENAFTYLHARQEQKEMETDAEVAVHKGKVAATGTVTIPATSKSFNGLTFLTFDVDRPSTARLIDMGGKVVHEWHRSFRDIWPNPPHKATPSPENAIAWRYAELFPNGDIIAVIISYGDTPYGYGLVKLDKDSNVIWSVADNFHHHFSIDKEGRIFGLTHQWRDTRKSKVSGGTHLAKRVLEDFIVELSPDGKEINRVSLLDALGKSGFGELLDSSFVQDFHAKAWDPIHANDVEVIDASFAAKHPFCKPGMVMVSVRELDALLVIDMETKLVVWSMRGAWLRQHDPDLLPGGNILLFDNRGDNNAAHGSRLIEFNPDSGKIVWSYAGTATHPFRSDKSGGEERLPNGDTLVSEDDGGRVFEIDPGGQINWEYRDVHMHHATRFARESLTFLAEASTITQAAMVPSGMPSRP